MLSYQHAFHAGNHADVLKHISLIAILQKLNQKAKPYFVLDTHAGAGMYDLSNAPSKADATAFDKLLNAFEGFDEQASQSAAVSDYVKLIKQLYAKSIYPGSPILLSSFAREQDNVHANELSAAMFAELEDSLSVKVGFDARSAEVQVHQRDAFELIKAMTPPKPNRGLILIDPPYEQATEYEDVVASVSAALKKWSNGCFMIWYPLLSETRINRKTQEVERNPKAKKSAKMLSELASKVSELCSGGMLSIEFANQKPSESIGMYGSGVCIINPPYKIEEQLQVVLTLLQEHLKLDSNELSNLHWHVKAQ